MFDSDISNFIVEQTHKEKHYRILGGTFSQINNINNANRKLDKEVRVSCMVFSGEEEFKYNYDFNTSKRFYKRGKENGLMFPLKQWFSLLDNIKGKGKRRHAHAFRLLVSSLFENGYEILDSNIFIKHYQKFENPLFEDDKQIKYYKGNQLKFKTYKEMCSSHSSAEIKKRHQILEKEFLSPNMEFLIKNNIIQKFR